MRYFLVTYIRRPNGQIDEVTAVARNLKKKDIQMVNVILDFREQTVIKCSMDGRTVPRVWDTITSYYYQHYANTMERLFHENGHALPEKPAEPVAS
jgi:hypothetical protein